MASQATETVMRQLRRIVLFGGGAHPDATLLGKFIDDRDEDAFAALVRRHGPMVLGVCQRVLANRHDAEDAFQATFLVLVRKATAIRPREMVGNWLYGVARQTAIRLRALNGKRRGRERPMANIPEPQAPTENAHDDMRRWLDREISRLPNQYRAAIVACDLEGKSRDEAARQLGWREGSLSSRLARGRAMLAKRLAKHGPALSVAALATAISQSASATPVPPTLILGTIKAASLFAAGQTAATGALSAKVVALAEGMICIMNVTKWATTTLAICLLTGLGAGLGWGGYQLVQGGSPASQPKAAAIQDVAPPNKAGGAAKKQTDKERIVGVWRIKSGETDGKDIAPDFSSGGRFRFMKDGTMTFAALNEVKSGTYKIAEPGKIDLGPDGEIAPAIYRFDGNDRLTLCFGTDKVRPTEFAAKQGERRFMWHLVRAKPGEEKPTQEEIDRQKAEPTRPDGLPALKEKASREVGMNQLRQIGIAFFMHHEVEKSYPAHAIYSADGKTPLLSWRVAILPFIDEKALYDQFKLDQPWDSEHNKKLIPKMPKIYVAPFAVAAKPGETNYQVVTGPKTLFDGAKKALMKDIFDGTTNTLLVVEAKDPVIWTKPADLTLPEGEDQKLPVGGHYTNGFHALFCDGTVRFLSATTPADMLRALVTPKDGRAIDPSKLEAPK